MSTNLTLTCKLQDTAPTGPAIGKRSVPSDYDVINSVKGEMEGEGEMIFFLEPEKSPTHNLNSLKMKIKMNILFNDQHITRLTFC